MVLNTENLFTDETVEIPADTYVPEERSEMPYADFRAMTEEVRGGGPIYEREDGSVLSMAEAYDALNAAQLRQMRRLWEAQQAERDLSDAQAERMVRRMGAMNEGVSSSDFEAYMDAVRELTDAQDAAEARSLGIEPEEDE